MRWLPGRNTVPPVSGLNSSRQTNTLSAIGPFLAQATGFWLLGRWADSNVLMGTSILMLGGSVATGSLTSGDVAVGLQFALYGACLLTAARLVAAQPSPT